MTRPSSRVAIVTGASRGIGRRIAERLAAEQFAVVISYLGEKNSADEVVAGIRAAGGTATATQADVADVSAVERLFSSAAAEFGGVDVLVHAAAILTSKPLVDLTIEEIDAMLRTNLRGTLIVDRQAARSLRRGGAIVNISSAITRNQTPGYTVYSATKAGLEEVTVILARELSGRDITVNAVAPGPTASERLTADLANSPDPAAMRQAIVERVPLGRIGTADDIADVVLALTKPARWVNGQTVHANGGLI